MIQRSKLIMEKMAIFESHDPKEQQNARTKTIPGSKAKSSDVNKEESQTTPSNVSPLGKSVSQGTPTEPGFIIRLLGILKCD